MLSMNNYSQAYIDDCRTRVQAQLASYSHLIRTAEQLATTPAKIKSANETFEIQFFNNMVIVLESYFVHRGKVNEGKDGNALNEVKMLCNSIMNHAGMMTADKTIKYKPETAVIPIKIGDAIKLNEAGFKRLAEAFFSEIERNYVSEG